MYVNMSSDDLNFIFTLINATNLHCLEVNINNFGCKFPEYIGNLSRNLQYLNLDHNHIFGSIPSGIVNLVGLQILNMQLNQFTGTIPSEIGKLQNLHRLNLDNNSLSGYIPFSLGNLSLLIRLPKQVVSVSSLSILLDLSQNQLSGLLPTEVANLINLGYLDVSYNLLSSEIPRSGLHQKMPNWELKKCCNHEKWCSSPPLLSALWSFLRWRQSKLMLMKMFNSMLYVIILML
ncbi:hypothetical protein ACSBR1_013377 [Camellia fascicularis]